MNLYIFAGQINFPWWFIFMYYGGQALILIAFVFLLIQTALSFKRPITAKGKNRRVAVSTVWIAILSILIIRMVTIVIENKQSDNFNSNLSVSYAKTYNHPVILPTSEIYKIFFDGKWAQIIIYLSKNNYPAANDYILTQVPITKLGKKYFDPISGYCDFSSMRENYELLRRSDETCRQVTQINDFTLYKSSQQRYYATYHDIAIEIERFQGQPTDTDSVQILENLKATNNDELVKVMGEGHFSGAYSEVIDRWHKEGKF